MSQMGRLQPKDQQKWYVLHGWRRYFIFPFSLCLLRSDGLIEPPRVLSGKLAMLGLPMPITIGPVHFTLGSLTKVIYPLPLVSRDHGDTCLNKRAPRSCRTNQGLRRPPYLLSRLQVSYVGFGGPLFAVTVKAEEYIFEASSQADRNGWVQAIQMWIR